MGRCLPFGARCGAPQPRRAELRVNRHGGLSYGWRRIRSGEPCMTPSGGIGEIGVSDGVVELAMSSAHRDYSHRSTVDKLGIKTGDVVVLVEAGGTIEDELRRQIEERVGELSPEGDMPADVVLIAGDASTDVVALLEEWKRRIRPAGGIW